MEYSYTPYILITLSVAAVCLFFSVYAWTRNDRASEAVPLSLLMLSVTWMLIAYTFGLTSLDLEAKMLWIKMEFVGVAATPLLLLVYTIYRTHRKKWLTSRRLIFLAIIPVTSVILMWTTEWHGLMYAEYSIHSEGPPMLLDKTFGIWLWVNILYSYLLVIIAITLLIRSAINSSLYRWQNISFVIAILVPWVGNFVAVSGIDTIGGMDLWPLLLAVSGIIMSFAFFGLRLLNIVPVARDAIAEIIGDAVLVLDRHNNIVDINPSAQQMLGLVPSQVIGVQISDILHGQLDQEQLIEETGKESTEIVIINDAGESYYDTRITPLKSKRGNVVGRLLLLNNITQRKQAEVTLRESEERFRLIFESVPEGIVVTDLVGKILDINNGAIRMHGYNSKEELLGQSSNELIVERDLAICIESAKNSLKTGRTGFIQCAFKKKDGSEFTAVASQAVLKDAKGQPREFVAVTADITEQKKRQEQLMLTDRLASIGQLASGIAHEINNPLTSVIGFTELLLEKDFPDDIREDLEIVDEEAKRAANVIRGLLAFVRNKVDEKVPVNINSIIQEVLRLRSYEQRTSNIKVATQLDPDLPQVTANGAHMQQVFMNIVINAEQAMLETNRKGNLKITTEKSGDMIRASIVDDGPGISPENMKNLFSPFFTTKEVGKGTGLGLSICHGIITEHGGILYAESELDKGACFILELPIKTHSN